MEFLADVTWPQVAVVGGFITGVGAVLGWIVKRLVPFLRNMGHFFDDWFGESPRPGVDGRPGVPEQLKILRRDQVRVAAELKTNGGKSVKDVTNQNSTRLAELTTSVDALGKRVDNLAAALGGKAVVEQASQLAAHQEGTNLWQAVSDVAATTPHEE